MDNEITTSMLPISIEYAAYLVDVFLMPHVAQLAGAADNEAARSRA